LKLKKNILFISGPTASGKSDLAIKIALAIKGEIINADSMQIYKDLKVITARPSVKEQKKIKHHLYGYLPGNKRYNVFNWCNDALKKIKEIENCLRVPIVVGGTGLYFHSFINGIARMPTIPEEIKRESEEKFKKNDLESVYDELKNFDPDSISKIRKNDIQRLKRIWEVMRYTGVALSTWQKKANKKFIDDYNFKLILILPNREKLYRHSEKRFLNMINNGALEEVRKLKEKNYDNKLPIMKAHGVPEIMNYFSGIYSLDEAISKAQQVTKNYIKRQFTWWKGSKIKPDEVFHNFSSNIDLKSLKILKKFNN
tara:strand:+ start:4304 stop:5242 length:939 start_codon:yes stop_codon:yes gene_type:complete